MTPRATLAFLVIVVGVYLAWGGHYVQRTSIFDEGERVYVLWDDAMISMHYARNLSQGEGLVFNAGGEPVQGITNPALTLMMAAVHLLPVSLQTISLVVQLAHLALLATILLLLYQLARRLFPESHWIAVGTALATVVSAPHAVWTLQGTEVGWVSLWLVSLVALLARQRSDQPQSSALLLAVLGAGLLIRWDSAAFYGVFLLVWLSQTGDRGRRLLLGGGVLAGVLGSMMLLSWLYYGDPLPNTYYLKATGSPRHLVLGLGFERFVDRLPHLLAPLLAATFALYARRTSSAVVLAAGFCGMALLYNIWVGDDWAIGFGSRFVAPIYPLLLMLAVAGCWQGLRRVFPVLHRDSGWVTAILLVASLVLGISASDDQIRRDWIDPTQPPMYWDYNQTNYRLARYLARNTEPSTSIGVNWAGVPIYFSGRPAVDLLGKSDRWIAKLEVPRFIPGHSKWDWEYVVNVRKPDIILVAPRRLSDREDFLEAYRFVTNASGFRFFIREESQGKLTDPSAKFFEIPADRRIRRLALQLHQEVDDPEWRAFASRGWAQIAKLYERNGDMDAAIDAMRSALRLRPDWPVVENKLAWVLATRAAHDIAYAAEAVRLAERVVAATQPPNGSYLDTLATAYAAAGRFDDAQRTAEQALTLVRRTLKPEFADDVEARLVLFRAKRVYREP